MFRQLSIASRTAWTQRNRPLALSNRAAELFSDLLRIAQTHMGNRRRIVQGDCLLSQSKGPVRHLRVGVPAPYPVDYVALCNTHVCRGIVWVQDGRLLA